MLDILLTLIVLIMLYGVRSVSKGFDDMHRDLFIIHTHLIESFEQIIDELRCIRQANEDDVDTGTYDY